MKILFRYITLVSIAALLLIGCGGGGGKSGTPLTYTGNVEQATLNDINSVDVSTEAYQGGGIGTAIGGRSLSSNMDNTTQPERPRMLVISAALEKVVNWADLSSTSHPSRAALTAGLGGDFNCFGGRGTGWLSIDYNDQTGDFRGSFNLNGLCSDGVNLTGVIKAVGQIDISSGDFKNITLTLGSLSALSPASSYGARGTITYTYLTTYTSITMTLLLRDDATSKIYKVENYNITMTGGTDYVDVTIDSGRFYHPDHGYVDVASITPIRYSADDKWPSDGILAFSGSSGSKARLRLYMSEAYRIEIDANGDGLYESDSGMRHWINRDLNDASLFSPYQVMLTGSKPEAVAIGDVNNDGRNDVVVTTTTYSRDPENDYRLHVFLQNAYGWLEPATKYFAGYGGPVTIDIGDLNNDGRDDVVVGVTGRIGVFLQNDSATLDPMVIYPTENSRSLKIGDFNNDGLNDVVSIGFSTNSVDVFLQNPSGTLSTPVKYSISGNWDNEVDVGDVNNDGRQDIIVNITYGVGILYQESDGTFGQPVYYSTRNCRTTFGVAVGDINGDNMEDISLTCFSPSSAKNQLYVFYQNDLGTLDTDVNYPTMYSYKPEAIELGDINSNGRSDVIVSQGSSVGIYLQGVDGTLVQNDLYPAPIGTNRNRHGMAVGDINNDRSDDVVAVNGFYSYANGGALLILYNRY